MKNVLLIIIFLLLAFKTSTSQTSNTFSWLKFNIEKYFLPDDLYDEEKISLTMVDNCTLQIVRTLYIDGHIHRKNIITIPIKKLNPEGVIIKRGFKANDEFVILLYTTDGVDAIKQTLLAPFSGVSKTNNQNMYGIGNFKYKNSEHANFSEKLKLNFISLIRFCGGKSY